MTLQENLKQWAESAIEHYKKVLEELGRTDSFMGSQSPIDKISESPEIIILGKNPGHGGTFEDSEKFRAEFLKGNGSWGNRNKRKADGGWLYWRNIKSYLSKTFSKDLLEDDSKRVLTNATFFAAEEPKNLPPKAYEKTISCTLSLIDILRPKKNVVICMGASDYYRFITDFTEYNDKYACEGLFYGERNGIKYIGMPHPSGRQSKLKRELIKEFINAAVNSSSFDEIEGKLALHYERYVIAEKGKQEVYERVLSELDCLLANCKSKAFDPKRSTVYVLEEFDLYVILNDYDKRMVGIRHRPISERNTVSPLNENQKDMQDFIEDQAYKSNKYWNAYKYFEEYKGKSPEECAKSILKEINMMLDIIRK